MSTAPALIVEDLPEIREWLTGVLQKAFPGLSAVTAGTLRDASSLIDSGREFRLALVDLGLPVTLDEADEALKASFAEVFGPVARAEAPAG